ncbi:MAG: SDR family oxidoreductase [Pseudomonadota bacterium]
MTSRFLRIVLLVLFVGPAFGSPTVLVTGSNRGIGLEFVRQYAEQGATVLATCRTPASAGELNDLAKAHSNIQILQLDVTSAEQMAALKQSLDGQPIDILINNAALVEFSPRQEFGQLDYEFVSAMINVNALGPLRVAEALVENVAASEQKKLINITSSAGSIGRTRPGFLGYRASKATLNSIMYNLSLQLAQRDVLVGLINPGNVDTRGILDMTPETAPPEFQMAVKMVAEGKLKPQRTPDAVKNLIGIIDGMSMQDSGRFIDYTGETLPW